MSTALKIHCEDPEVCVASLQNIMITLVNGEMAAVHVDAMRRALPHVVQAGAHGKSVGLTVVDANHPVLAKKEIRDQVAAFTREAQQVSLGAATVIDGQGLAASAVRTVVATMNLTSRASMPSKVFSNVDEALGWLVQFMEPTPDTADQHMWAAEIARLFAHRKLARAA